MDTTRRAPSDADFGEVYDPRQYGAECDRCLLGPVHGKKYGLREGRWVPVRFEWSESAQAIAVAQCPAEEEVSKGYPLAGRSGLAWHDVLALAGLSRPDLALSNVIKCQPAGQAGGAYDRMEKRIKDLRRTRVRALRSKGWANPAAVAQAEQDYPHPADCCRPALLWEVAHFRDVLTLGRSATDALVAEGRGRGMKKTHGVRFEVEPGVLESQTGHLSGTPGTSPPWLANTPGVLAGHRIVPTFHPAFVARLRSWMDVAVADLGRAWRWWTDCLRWVDPTVNIAPTVEQVLAYLAQPHTWRTYDTETTGRDPLVADCLCIGFANPRLRDGSCQSLVVPLTQADGVARYYTLAEEGAVLEAVARALTSDACWWIGHNVIQYDNPLLRRVLRRYLPNGVFRMPKVIDTLPLARLAAPDRPRSLGALGQLYTDVNDWKNDHTGRKVAILGGLEPEKLIYCGVDCTVNGDIYEPVRHAAEAMGAFRLIRSDIKPPAWEPGRPYTLYEVDKDACDFCAELHEVGMWVDQAERKRLVDKYTIEADKLRAGLVQIAQGQGVKLDEDGLIAEATTEWEKAVETRDFDTIGVDSLNPNSFDQIGALIYGEWKLPVPDGVIEIDEGAWGKVEGYTASGRPSTADPILRALLVQGRLSREQEAFVRMLRLYRRYRNKVIGTLLRPLEVGRSVWRSDGRVHSSWNACGAGPGRLSSSSPNLQNVSARKGMGHLRRVFGPHGGPDGFVWPDGRRERRIYIIADYDQLHLRLIANLYRIPSLLRAFLGGEDAHVLHAYMLFGDKLKAMGGWPDGAFSTRCKPAEGSEADGARSFAKNHIYASAYWAMPATKARVLQSMETKPGVMPYLRRTLADVESFHDNWLYHEPEWKTRFWMPVLRECMTNGGRAIDPIMGRQSAVFRALRTDGKPGPDVNDAVNFGVLAGERAIAAQSEKRLRARFPLHFDGFGTGLVNQKHDEYTLEALDHGDDANDRLCDEFTELMTVRIPGHEVLYTAKAHWVRTWK